MNPDNSTNSIYDHAEGKGISTRQVLDLTVLTNPLGPSEKAKHAMRKALKSVHLAPDAEVRYLRRYIAKKEGIPAESILFGHGATQLVSVLLCAFKPKRVAIPTPVPSHYRDLLVKQGGEVVPISLSRHGEGSLDVERMMTLLEGVDLFLAPNPHCLTGDVIPASTLVDLAQGLAGSEKLVVIDEGLLEYTMSRSSSVLAVQSKNVAVLRSFSLFHSMAGLRLGYLVGSPGVLEMAGKTFNPGPVSGVAAAGALASLRDAGFYKRTAEYLGEEKEYLLSKLAQATDTEVIDTPSNFVLVRCMQPPADIEGRLLRRHILIHPFEDNEKRACFRVPICRRRENARFAKTFLRITAQRNDAAVSAPVPE
jgi:threonine-phosphate decarboxylase